MKEGDGIYNLPSPYIAQRKVVEVIESQTNLRTGLAWMDDHEVLPL